MNRLITFAAASLITAGLFGAATNPALAAGSAAYRLVPAAAVASANTIVVNDVLWKLSGEAYVATKVTSRPAIACAQAARKVGKLASFSAEGQEFSAEELAKCNEKAR